MLFRMWPGDYWDLWIEECRAEMWLLFNEIKLVRQICCLEAQSRKVQIGIWGMGTVSSRLDAFSILRILEWCWVSRQLRILRCTFIPTFTQINIFFMIVTIKECLLLPFNWFSPLFFCCRELDVSETLEHCIGKTSRSRIRFLSSFPSLTRLFLFLPRANDLSWRKRVRALLASSLWTPMIFELVNQWNRPLRCWWFPLVWLSGSAKPPALNLTLSRSCCYNTLYASPDPPPSISSHCRQSMALKRLFFGLLNQYYSWSTE